jgi:hypothetical protein
MCTFIYLNNVLFLECTCSFLHNINNKFTYELERDLVAQNWKKNFNCLSETQTNIDWSSFIQIFQKVSGAQSIFVYREFTSFVDVHL